MDNGNKGKQLTIFAISDTHGNNHQLQKAVDDKLKGDLFIHAGDFTNYNRRQDFADFVLLLSQLDFQHKIVIPGNHQILLDPDIPEVDRKYFGISYIHEDMTTQRQIERLKEVGVTYLTHDYIEIGGLRIFASSYTVKPFYWSTAFQIEQEKLKQIWTGVPTEIDLLITHGPPFEVLDFTIEKKYAGSKTIREYLQKSKAKAHIFGHIHETKGQSKVNNIMCYNVAQNLTKIQIIVENKQIHGKSIDDGVVEE